MKTITVVLMLIFIIVASYKAGFDAAQIDEMRRWKATLDKISPNDSEHGFIRGVLWAFEKAVMEKEDGK